ncbi:hypothetical protein ACFP56_01515 [Paenibacillus septentrionalis]|uniref:Uncharacterized protein n=2 Tax=Paenibacillus septentrionalis TaxID=429342 RepID=A0ABW1UXW3_9BACL
MRKNSSLIGVLACCVIIAACSIVTGNRTAEQWLELLQAGVVAEDNFRFSGTVVMGFEDGLALTPFAFNGEIEEHKQIALHAEQSSSLVHNPVNEIEFIAQHYKEAEITHNGLDEAHASNIVVLQVQVDEKAATERWKELLKQELSNVGLEALTSAKEQNKHLALVQQEIDRSQRELEEMLNKLNVEMQVELTIDPSRIVPLQMNENITMKYVKDGMDIHEFRKSNIKFDLSPDEVVR